MARPDWDGVRCWAASCEKPVSAKGWCKYHYDLAHKGRSARSAARRAETVASRPDYQRCLYCETERPKARFRKNSYKCLDCARLARSKPCPDCGERRIDERTARCRVCHKRYRAKPSSSVTGDGYVKLSGYWDHPNSQSRGHIFEHTLVMSQKLGRPLRPGENVHHKNGVRADNRPENLELWVVHQPYGQRAADLVAWAQEILERYEAEVSAQ